MNGSAICSPTSSVKCRSRWNRVCSRPKSRGSRGANGGGRSGDRMAGTLLNRRLSAGVEPHDDGCHARVWAPACRSVDFVIDRGGNITQSPKSVDIQPLEREGEGFFSGHVAARPGERYWFRLDGGRLRPDPRSRSQPQGPHGPSEVVNPTSFAWTDAGWKGVTRHGQVVYELHVGTFTAEGTWAAAARELPALRDLGVT